MDVVISSIGVISSLGFSLDDLIKNLDGAKKLLSSTFHSSGVAVPTVPIEGFDFQALCGRNKNRRYLSRAGQMSVASALRCADAASLTANETADCSLFIGAGPFLEQEASDFSKRQALWLLKHLPNSASSVIASTLGLHGEALTVGSACAASLHAIGCAFRSIKNGETVRAFAGGGDSRLSAEALNGYLKAGALYSRDDGGEGYSPLLGEPVGFIPGEGAGFFLLEEKSVAIARGATIYAEVLGFGATTDGYNMTAPDPSGIPQEMAIKKALKMAGLELSDIDKVSAHGTGTPLNDAMENGLHHRLFACDSTAPKIVAYKKLIGHLASGCGAVELAIELAGYKKREERGGALPNQTITLLENFGFGGQNGVLIIRSPEVIDG